MIINIHITVNKDDSKWFIDPTAESKIEITTKNSDVKGVGAIVDSMLAGAIQQYNAAMLAQKEEEHES